LDVHGILWGIVEDAPLVLQYPKNMFDDVVEHSMLKIE